ncbi:hypothetical protein AAULH_11991 [Lactobacillus helveticus MTCC 5463]|nr:hypothetical protein AAULH_11991 [Lactobacillus helveticus MTCC 5463]
MMENLNEIKIELRLLGNTNDKIISVQLPGTNGKL